MNVVHSVVPVEQVGDFLGAIRCYEPTISAGSTQIHPPSGGDPSMVIGSAPGRNGAGADFASSARKKSTGSMAYMT
jgi:hypothetical protein